MATSSSGTGEYSKTLLSHQRLDLLAVPGEAEEEALVDDDGRHREPARQPEHLGTGLGVTSHRSEERRVGKECRL